MTPRPLYLIDSSANRLAALNVAAVGDHFVGTIALDATPPPLRALFAEFEELVEGQVLSLLDDIEARIAATSLRVVFEDGSVAPVADLQVFPSTNAVSFKVRQPEPVR